MGVDGALFAIKAKRRLYFDRYYNLISGDHDPRNIEIRLGEADNVTASEVRALLLYKDYLAELGESTKPTTYTLYWRDQIRAFVAAFPDDTFFALNDHHDGYRDASKDYVEWKP